MDEKWEKQLACAEICPRCSQPLGQKDKRILSVYDHRPVCLTCKKEEEKKPDYEDMTREMISACMETENRPYGNPASFCFHHFCPYKCAD